MLVLLHVGWQAAGTPLVNTTRWPSVARFCSRLHAMNLTCGWYMNNCGCKETGFTDPGFIASVYAQSAAALLRWGVDEVKLDGCSQWRDTARWQRLLIRGARPALGKFPLENCHNDYGDALTTGTQYPIDLATCPFTTFRTSSDIRPVWERVIHNLQTVIPYLSGGTESSLSRPGCTAHPDVSTLSPVPD